MFIHGAASGITVIALFALHVVTGRYLGAEQYGILSFGMAYAALFLAIFDPGIQQLTVRELSRDHAATSMYVAQAGAFKLMALPVVLLTAIAILTTILDSSLAIAVSTAMFMSMWLNSMKDSLRPVFIAHERFELNARILIFERVGLLAVVSAFCFFNLGLWGVVAAFLMWRIIDLGYAAYLVNKHLARLSFSVRFPLMKEIIIRAIPIGAFYLTNYVYNYLDTIMIGAMRESAEVGWYSAAYRLYEGLMIIPAVISGVFMPRISRAYSDDKISVTQLVRSGVGLALAAGLVCTTGLTLLGPWVIALFYGPDFMPSGATLVILGYGICFAFLVQFIQTALISINRQNVILWFALFGLVINAALNLYLIPRYGQIGAAWATVITLVVTALCLVSVAGFSWRKMAIREGRQQDKRL
jgi:O-antigen/teichoic acid export membrane protein